MTKKKAKPGSGKAGKFNAQQKRFAALLLADPNENQTKAYMTAYDCTNEKAAAASASRLLKNASLRAYIDEKRDAMLRKRFEASQERIVEEIACLGFSRVSDFTRFDGKTVEFKSFDEIPPQLLGAVSSIEKDGDKIRLKFHKKEKALEMLARWKKMFGEKLLLDTSDTLNAFLKELSGRTLGPPSQRNQSAPA
jgi:phage terminase small subunit